MPSAIVVGRGRMGSLIKQTLTDHSFDVIGSYDAQNCAELDTEAPAADVVVDFSNACALPHVLAYVTRTGAALVSGTTGYDESDLVELRSLGEKTRVVYSANYSLGIAVLRRAATQAARALFEWDIEIVETHHNQKADAPSGTAKLLLHAIDPEGDERVVNGRVGMIGPRPKGEIGMHALRGGTVAGTHEVHFFGQDEELCFTHRANSRQIFVNGAVACAQRILACKNGFYTFDQLMLQEEEGSFE